MKKIAASVFLLITSCTTLFAQTEDTLYKKYWLEIDTLVAKKNLTKTALEKTVSLFAKAKKEQQPAQQVKALLYRFWLERNIHSETINPLYDTIRNELKQSKDPAQKAVLHALLARLYREYFMMNLSRLYPRANVHSANEDIETWGMQDFAEKIAAEYRLCLTDVSLLQSVPVTNYSAIIIQGTSGYQHKTLYDLLIQEALEYFTREEIYISRAVNTFVITDPAALAGIDKFCKASFTAKDSSSAKWISLRLFQQLVSFHQKDKDPNALIRANLFRLNWVYSGCQIPDREILYQKALHELTDRYPAASEITAAWYLIALNEANHAEQYRPYGDSTYRLGYLTAEKIISQTLKAHKTENEGTRYLRNLLSKIQARSVSSEAERINVPGKPFRVLVKYRNIDTVYARIVATTQTPANPYDFEELRRSVLAGKTIREFQQLLPGAADHQPHAAEIKIDALPVGEYALILSEKAPMNDSGARLSIQSFAVTNIAYFNSRNDFFVVERTSGKPIQDVKVRIIKQVVVNGKQRFVYDTIATRYTDKNGHFYFEPNTPGASYTYLFDYRNDHFNTRMPRYLNASAPGITGSVPMSPDAAAMFEKQMSRIYFFTDRAIYRPGQWVFFKGIGITRDAKNQKSRLITDRDSGWVVLLGANRQKIDSIKIALNDFGSFAGKFRIPEKILTGYFSIEYRKYNNYSSTGFSVEEYKRPKFSISMDPVKGSYRYNDSITVSGNAISFSGNMITGAKLSYRISRNTRITAFETLRHPYQQFPQREIAFGELKTDEQGKFRIRFKAAAEDISSHEGNPVSDFTIHVEATDLNGETHSADTRVTAAFSSLQLFIPTQLTNDADSLKKIFVSTRNYSNQPVAANVHIKISALLSPSVAYRSRYWQRPDQFLYTKAQYSQDFPTDVYDNEADYQNWPKGKTVAEGMVATANEKFFSLSNLTLDAGYYKIEASTIDSFGEKITQTGYCILYSVRNKQMAAPAGNFCASNSQATVAGSNAVFYTGSSAPELFVIATTDPTGAKATYAVTKHQKGLRSIEIKAAETGSGQLGITEAYVYDNRFYTNPFFVFIKKNKKINLRYSSYRNKTEPGSKETWTIHVEGSEGGKLAAEIMTGMYDASLDQFRPNNWVPPYLETNSFQQASFNAYDDFMKSFSVGNDNRMNIFSETEPSTNNRLTANGGELIIRDLTQWIKDSAFVKTRKWDGNVQKILETVTIKDEELLSISRKPGVMLRGNIPEGTFSGTLAGNATDYSFSAAAKDSKKFFGSDELLYDKVYTNASNSVRIQGNGAVEIAAIRRDFSETAFFLPQVYADSAGNYQFSFTMPEAITKWKWLTMAHTANLDFETVTQEIVTQKTLMVQPNAPRFVREGDAFEFSAKLVNAGDKELSGQATLELVDAATGASVDGWFQNVFPAQYFTAEAGQSTVVKFPIQVPYSFNRTLTWRVKAVAGNFSDGEENSLPVLTNRILITESMPLYLSQDTTQHFIFEKLKNNTSESLTHEAVTVEFSSNPAWYAVQSLPYLMEYPYECAEQTFNRFYANTLAAWLVNKNPSIRKVFEEWKKDGSASKSPLAKNEELKQVLLREMPWALEAASEEEQKKKIALLFDPIRIASETNAALAKLKEMQLTNGAFSWFKGGYEDAFITNYILTGMGKLVKLGALIPEKETLLKSMAEKALLYLDTKHTEQYAVLQKNKAGIKEQVSFSHDIHYLYMRSFFNSIPLKKENLEAWQYSYNQARINWVKLNTYEKALLGLACWRNGDKAFVTADIVPALLENTVAGNETGLYWKNAYTWSWYESPVEHQSAMIAFFSEINREKKEAPLTKNIDAMKTWLVLNKQTNHWKTTIATADACYALLQSWGDWLTAKKNVEIQVGKSSISNTKENTEAGTGYFKKRFENKFVDNSMGDITVTVQSHAADKTKPNSSPSWGAVYWQYFEEMDRISAAASPLSITKKIFIEKNTGKGPVLFAVTEGNELKAGDKLVIRLELQSDRDMEYLHLKDLRAAGMEPLNVLSGYKWQNGLGYYESTGDISSNFFIPQLKKGRYVFEYPVYLTHSGDFMMGIASIQSMYAPEFNSHSAAMKLHVGN